MRIREPLELAGTFWMPTNPRKRVPGTLTIGDGGDIHVELTGSFESLSDALGALGNSRPPLGRVLGNVDGFGPLTLEGCFYRSRNFGSHGAKSKIRANQAFLGARFRGREVAKFNRMELSIEGIDEWVGISGIHVHPNFTQHSLRISYKKPEVRQIELGDGFVLSVDFRWTLPSLPAHREARVSQKTYLRIHSAQPRPIEDFAGVAHKLTTLLSLASDAIVCIEEVTMGSDSLTRSGPTGKRVPINIAFYYGSLPFSNQVPKVNRADLLFAFDEATAAETVGNWFAAYECIEPTLSLYFATKAGAHRFLESKFLALAQALETYHRRLNDEKVLDVSTFDQLVASLIERCPDQHKAWLAGRLMHGNEPSLRQRLNAISEPYKSFLGAGKGQKSLMTDIVNTRNYLTHYDPSLKDKAVRGMELWVLCQRMEGLLQLRLLEALGFSRATVESIATTKPLIRDKFKPA